MGNADTRTPGAPRGEAIRMTALDLLADRLVAVIFAVDGMWLRVLSVARRVAGGVR